MTPFVRRLSTALAPFAVGGTLALTACRPADGLAPSGEPFPPAAVAVDAAPAVWWTWMDQACSATVWVSPVVVEGGQTVRMVSMTCALPGSPEPLSVIQGGVVAEGADTFTLLGNTFQVDARPQPGLRWSDVRSTQDLAVETRGVFYDS